jgi:hypothetical protein
MKIIDKIPDNITTDKINLAYFIRDNTPFTLSDKARKNINQSTKKFEVNGKSMPLSNLFNILMRGYRYKKEMSEVIQP